MPAAKARGLGSLGVDILKSQCSSAFPTARLCREYFSECVPRICIAQPRMRRSVAGGIPAKGVLERDREGERARERDSGKV